MCYFPMNSCARVMFSLTALCARLASAQPSPQTSHAFEQYGRAVEHRIERDLRTPQFLRLAADPAVRARLRQGEIVVRPAKSLGLAPAIPIPGGQVQHWIGAAFVPGIRIAAALPALQDYANRPRYMPSITESRIVSRHGDDFEVYLRLVEKSPIKAAFDVTLHIAYRRPEESRLAIESKSTEIREIAVPGAPVGTVARDRGLLWGFDHYWRFEEGDGGLYLECEALVLVPPNAGRLSLDCQWPDRLGRAKHSGCDRARYGEDDQEYGAKPIRLRAIPDPRLRQMHCDTLLYIHVGLHLG